ncbi:histidine phosphatase family protein [Roseibaca sp. V10]|uniref:Histidine phosphatase family protein n=1 Tax=Roseinatronobacter domitianus TaxID=2940293 RepID=A0ABT0M3Y3_9RHOB|nr:histidine phosphatase family protein [Roseibaca domitiana]MCL1629555.1 histidine phosphatase family protein [Roseibaca domitiana]
MTLRLILTRHAKSDWDNPLDSDHSRPLSARGVDSAPRIGRWLSGKGYLPGQALVSDATRTRQTWDLIAAELPDAPVPEVDRYLYLAGPDVLLGRLRRATAPCVMLVAHNPGTGEFAAAVLQSPVAHDAFNRYPTCATLVAEFDLPDWSSLDYKTGRAADFIVPRDLD